MRAYIFVWLVSTNLVTSHPPAPQVAIRSDFGVDLSAIETFAAFARNPVAAAATAFIGPIVSKKPLETRSVAAVRRVLRSPRGRHYHGAPVNAAPGVQAPVSEKIQILEELMPLAIGSPRTPFLQAVKRGISQREMDEIDAAIATGAAVPVRELKGRELFDAQAKVVVDTWPTGGTAKPGVQPTRPPMVKTPPVANPSQRRTSVGNRSNGPIVSANTPAGTDQSGVRRGGPPEESPLNLSSILGGVSAIAGTAAGLAGTYYQLRALREGRPVAAAGPTPPPVTPAAAPPVAPVNPRSGFQFDIPGVGLDLPWTAPNTPQAAPLPAPTLSGGGVYTRRAQAIAAATGQPVEQVAAILAAGRPRRRRRRMLTKSDIADISTMSALLGKNSESFKTWLAGALRR